MSLIWFEIRVIKVTTNRACSRSIKYVVCTGNNHEQKNATFKSSQFRAQMVGTNRLKLQRWRSNRPLRSTVFVHSGFSTSRKV
jgi:hypothetical protein